MAEICEVDMCKERIGDEIYVSEWISISQADINAFGKVTRDDDPIHIDPEFARSNGPFGATVLFGFQILSMLSYLCRPLRFKYETGAIGYDLNYGMDRVRFVTPIFVNQRFRNRVVLKKVERRNDHDRLLTTINTIEIEGQLKPALVAEWIGLVSRR